MAEWKKYDETTFTDFGSVGETMPAEDSGMGQVDYERTVPVDGGAGMNGAPTPYLETIPDLDSEETTIASERDPWANQETVFDMPGIQNSAGEMIRPATGWLVCVDGKTKGTDYRLYQG